MNIDISLLPKLHPVADVFPWCEVLYTACLSPTQSNDTAVWVSTLPVPQNPPKPISKRMDLSRHPHHPGQEETETPTDPGENQLDLFRKLGYSPAQVRAVLQKLGLNTDTNRVLGELVRSGASPEEMEKVKEKGGPQLPAMSVLVSRGDSTAKTHTNLPFTLSPSQEDTSEEGDALRPVVIDGSNVAMSHGNKEVFSCLGIQLAVNFFLDRGHSDITVFVPSWRKEQPRPDVPITDQHILRDLEKKKILVFTPSRRVAGKRLVCYDDRFIVKLAHETDGIIVSNDTYRDLQGERQEWKVFIEERLLMYSFVNDKFMPPDDPLGRRGPTLDNFLRKIPRAPRKQPCPYGKKCTYGIKCKFYHPERANQSHRSLADELREKAKLSSSHHKQQQQQQQQHITDPGQAYFPSLEEEMAQKLTLEQWNDSLKKGHTTENLVLVKGGHRSSRWSPSKKDKASRHSPADLDSPFPSGSQEHLDSGLGSIDSQVSDTPWDRCDRYRAGYRNCQSTPSVRQRYSPSNNPPCSCCSHAPPSVGVNAGFQHPSQHHSMGPASTHNSDMMTYCPPCYPNYGAAPPMYPVSMPAYSHPNHFTVPPPQQAYWSDPFGGYPQALHSTAQGERSQSHWAPPQRTQPSPHREEREEVRKKLLAIFNGRLVDRAMDMFPQLLDPQRLAAEILSLQSQDRGM